VIVGLPLRGTPQGAAGARATAAFVSRKSAASGGAPSARSTFARFARRPSPARGAPGACKGVFSAAFGAGAGIDLQQHPAAAQLREPERTAVQAPKFGVGDGAGFDQLA